MGRNGPLLASSSCLPLAGSSPVEVWSWGKNTRGTQRYGWQLEPVHQLYPIADFLEGGYSWSVPMTYSLPKILLFLLSSISLSHYFTVCGSQLAFLYIIWQCTNPSTYTQTIWPSFFVKQIHCSPVMANRKTSVHFDNLSLIFYFRKLLQETISINKVKANVYFFLRKIFGILMDITKLSHLTVYFPQF